MTAGKELFHAAWGEVQAFLEACAVIVRTGWAALSPYHLCRVGRQIFTARFHGLVVTHGTHLTKFPPSCQYLLWLRLVRSNEADVCYPR